MISRGIFNVGKEQILSKVSEAELAAMYIPNLKEIPQVINSPLREDKHPSFRVYSPDGVRVKYYDYATGESGGIINLIMRLFSCSFVDALERIDNDIAKYRQGIKIMPTQARGNLKIRSDNPDFQIRSQRRPWEDWDFKYWDSYGVPKEWLLYADIYPISYIFVISENGYLKTLKADKYAYTFIERKDGKITEKIYQNDGYGSTFLSLMASTMVYVWSWSPNAWAVVNT